MKLVFKSLYVHAVLPIYWSRCEQWAKGKLHGIPGSQDRTRLAMREGPYDYP